MMKINIKFCKNTIIELQLSIYYEKSQRNIEYGITLQRALHIRH